MNPEHSFYAYSKRHRTLSSRIMFAVGSERCPPEAGLVNEHCATPDKACSRSCVDCACISGESLQNWRLLPGTCALWTQVDY